MQEIRLGIYERKNTLVFLIHCCLILAYFVMGVLPLKQSVGNTVGICRTVIIIFYEMLTTAAWGTIDTKYLMPIVNHIMLVSVFIESLYHNVYSFSQRYDFYDRN